MHEQHNQELKVILQVEEDSLLEAEEAVPLVVEAEAEASVKKKDLVTLNTMTKKELLNVLEEFYTPEKQKQYGVVGIRIEKI